MTLNSSDISTAKFFRKQKAYKILLFYGFVRMSAYILPINDKILFDG